MGLEGGLLAFGTDSAAGRPALSNAGIARFYAGGDIVGLSTGSTITTKDGIEYHAARPVSIQAGGDIVNLKALVLNHQPNDVSASSPAVTSSMPTSTWPAPAGWKSAPAAT